LPWKSKKKKRYAFRGVFVLSHGFICNSSVMRGFLIFFV
jgi:hypothetical protein